MGVKNGTLAYMIVSGISLVLFVPCVFYAHNQDFRMGADLRWNETESILGIPYKPRTSSFAGNSSS